MASKSLIHLNGFPGVGKLTVAKLVTAALDARLIDNHLFVDICEAAVDRSSSYLPLLQKIQKNVFEALKTSEDARSWVFTNVLAQECTEDWQTYNALKQLAADSHRVFVPILIICSEEENLNRVVGESRKAKRKLTRPAVLQEIRQQYTIIHEDACPTGLILDVSQLSAQQSCTCVLEHLENLKYAA